jgi:hypothetical protein
MFGDLLQSSHVRRLIEAHGELWIVVHVVDLNYDAEAKQTRPTLLACRVGEVLPMAVHLIRPTDEEYGRMHTAQAELRERAGIR